MLKNDVSQINAVKVKVVHNTFSNETEEHVLVCTDFKVCWKADSSGTDIPEEHTKCIDIDTVIILARYQLWRHVQWRTDYASRHHRFRLAEPEVR